MVVFQGSEILVLRYFLVSSGIRQVCDGKTAWKKNIEIVGSFNGITTTCKLMTRIFFHNSELIAVCHVYVTQSSLKRPIHAFLAAWVNLKLCLQGMQNSVACQFQCKTTLGSPPLLPVSKSLTIGMGKILAC